MECTIENLGLLELSYTSEITTHNFPQNTMIQDTIFLQQNQNINKERKQEQPYQKLLNLWENIKQKTFTSHNNIYNGLSSFQDFVQYCSENTTTNPFFGRNINTDSPKIIICSSDEIELCFNAVSFLQSFFQSFHAQKEQRNDSIKNENINSLFCYDAKDFQSLNKNATKEQKDFLYGGILPLETNESSLPIVLPDIRLNPYDSIQTFYEEFHELFAKLTQWYENDCKQLLISPPHTLMAFLPSKELLHSFELQLHEHRNIEDIAHQLLQYGYERVEIVEMQGEFSWRGDILDIFVPNFINPIRISFFDTEIESIRYFSCETQLSLKEEILHIRINPAMFSLTKEQCKILESYIENLCHDGIEKNIHTLGFWFLKDIGGINFLRKYPHIFTFQALREYKENLEFVLPEILPSNNQTFRIFPLSQTCHDNDIIKYSNLSNTIKLNVKKDIFILSRTKALLKQLDFPAQIRNYDNSLYLAFLQTPFYFNITTPQQIFISLEKIQKECKKRVRLELDSLKPGEFVVHSEYGVGVFECIKQIDIMGGIKDFVSIIYANDDRLLVPVENLNLIEKYSAYDSVIKLDKLGKSSFLRLKDSIKEKLLEIANEIIRLQAQRDLSTGAKITLESAEQMIAYQKFEESRGFELTPDQNLAISESLKDLKSGRVMDRLLNGDVGFGKTEVAMSLCYATALNDLASIVLVPTTLLCNQHFESFKNRLSKLILPNNKPLKIAKLDRFTTTKQKQNIESAIKNQELHIIIGTHALFNLNIENLGLIVIDEEHKFGVKQKEILKQKSFHTHVLSMSATPIPRTLNMAYSKLKAISELHTPPFYKQESKTFVKIKKDSLIKEVITREIRRGGQVFYIFNNIAKIQTIQTYLLGLLPKLRILILHSKINPKDTEQGMIDFFNKQYDVLLCTSIVESGIHLPNANTIIIDEAHNFGIADLHQLRGRVGRGKVVGFCYLLTHENINEESSKRLLALEKNSYLGSGASLAYHDLEIRGGGNLLGQAQSGHIKQVGFGMYVRMLEETLQSLLQNGTKENKVDLKLSVSAFLNETLITSERMRLELYRRLSQVKNEVEVREIEGEIEQRFGKLDMYSLQFLELIIIKTLAIHLHIKALSNMGNNIAITNADNTKTYLQSPTKDDDDILLTIKTHLKSEIKKTHNQNNT
ncbi:DEAD/DEAH box helicase [Helicobacter didelphidarum]|nr:DEAD/DEAH box helicase [Helicobacter didelphidarum]